MLLVIPSSDIGSVRCITGSSIQPIACRICINTPFYLVYFYEHMNQKHLVKIRVAVNTFLDKYFCYFNSGFSFTIFLWIICALNITSVKLQVITEWFGDLRPDAIHNTSFLPVLRRRSNTKLNNPHGGRIPTNPCNHSHLTDNDKPLNGTGFDPRLGELFWCDPQIVQPITFRTPKSLYISHLFGLDLDEGDQLLFRKCCL